MPEADDHAAQDELPVPSDERLPATRERAAEGLEGIMNQLSRLASVDEGVGEMITAAQSGWAVKVAPPKHAQHDILEAGERLCRALHSEFSRAAMEIHKTAEDGTQFHYVVAEREEAERLRQLILSEYPNAEAEIKRSRLPIDTGDLVRADRIELSEDYLLPLLHANSAEPPGRDPMGALLDTLANTHNGRCVIQTVVEPVDRDWTSRIARGHPHRRDDPRWWRLPATRFSRFDAIEFLLPATVMAGAGAWYVTQWFAGGLALDVLFVGLGLVLAAAWWSALFGDLVFPTRHNADTAAEALRQHEWTEAKATRFERRTADQIAAQASEPGYRVSQRLITIGRREGVVDQLRDRVGAQLKSGWHDPHSGQQLRLRPMRRVPDVLERTAAREPIHRPIKHSVDKLMARPRRRSPSFMTPAELTSVACHLPDSSVVSKGGIDWAAPRLKAQIPPGAPRYRRPGGQDERPGPQHSPLARAGRLLANRLPGPLADRLNARGIGISEGDGVTTATLPEWVTNEDALDIEVDHRVTAHHEQYGEVEVELIREGDPTDPDDSTDVWMGGWLREIVESKRERPRDDLLIGYQEDGGTVREAAIPFDTIHRHIFIQGVTGGGKSTLAGVLLAQWANAGFGFCVPDPSGELIKDILRWLPEHRHEDVLYFSPEPDDARKVCGINLLSVGREPSDPDFDRKVDQQVDTLVGALRAAKDGMWGPRMLDIIRMLGRAMIEAPDEEFTLVDMHEAVIDQDARKEMADRAGKSDKFVGKITQRIAELDDEEFNSLLRRLNEWIASSIARQSIAHKGEEGAVDIEEAVTEDKIILFDNDLANGGLQRMLGTAVWSATWDACRDRPEGERTPYAVLADEFDDFISPEMRVDEQLRNARKYGLCLILMTQYLEAIGEKETEKAIDEECATTITLPIKGSDASKIASRLGLDSTEYLTKLEQYHALVEIEIENKPRGPFEISLAPPVAPARSMEEARETIVEPALERDGRDPITDEEIYEQQVLGAPDRDRFTATDEEGNVVEDDPIELDDERKRAVVRAIHDEAIVRGGDSDGVRLKHAADRIRDYHDRGEELADQSLSTILNRMPTGDGGLIDRREDEDGDIWVRATAEGRSLIFETGRSGSSGGAGHDQLLRDAYEPLLKLGLRPNIATQDGATKADGSLSVEWSGVEDVDWSGLSASRRRKLARELAEDNPGLAAIVLGRDAPLTDSEETDGPKLGAKDLTLALEAEKSTGKSKGGHTGKNVCKATNAGLRAVLLCRPDVAPKIEQTLTDPPFASSRYAGEGEVCHYNLDDLTIRGETMLRPSVPEGEGHDRTVWIHDLETGERILKDGSGEELARFDSAKEIYDGPLSYPGACDSDRSTPPGTSPVKEPLNTHEHCDTGEWPDENAWEIVIVPPDAEEPEDLALWRDGKEIPLDEIEDHSKADKARREILERFGHNDD